MRRAARVWGRDPARSANLEIGLEIGLAYPFEKPLAYHQ
jgi:hypothetical protein